MPTRRVLLRAVGIALGVLLVYVLVAYGFMGAFDRHKAGQAHYVENQPRLTHTGTGIPGDPLNVALVGAEEEIVRAMVAAKWFPADPLTFRSSMRIAVDTVFKKPDDRAPVSNLYLFGRKEDLAFEKPVGSSPKERHHVRFWRSEKADEGRPVWMGSAAFDIGVELSRTTGEVTHHISPDVDAERDLLIADMTSVGHVVELRWTDGFHPERQGKNGGGDPWRTDGRLAVVELTAGGSAPPPR